MKIASAGNTLTPAYLALKAKGFEVRPIENAEGLYYAVKGDLEFVAEDVVLLLGLVAMHEVRGDDWQATDDEIDAFVAEFGASD